MRNILGGMKRIGALAICLLIAAMNISPAQAAGDTVTMTEGTSVDGLIITEDPINNDSDGEEIEMNLSDFANEVTEMPSFESTFENMLVVRVIYGDRVQVYWKCSKYETCHARKTVNAKKGQHLYCSFTYDTNGGKGSVYLGIVDKDDQLYIVKCSGGVFSHTFVVKKTGTYRFICGNRTNKTIRVSGYYRVEK